MGKQIIILGLSGSFDPELAAGLVTQLQRTQSVRHVSHFYDGSGLIKFATGTQADLQTDLQLLSRAVPELPQVELVTSKAPAAEEGAPDFVREQLEEMLELLRGVDGRTTEHLQEFREQGKQKTEPRVPKALAHLEAHQVRVVMEKAALEYLIMKLDGFITTSEVFKGLPEAERERLVRQKSCMVEYAGILHERIVAFPTPPQKKKKGAAGEEEKPGVQAPAGPPVDAEAKAAPEKEPEPVRDVGGDNICTRCGAMFEDDLAAEDHLNGPMCELKQPVQG